MPGQAGARTAGDIERVADRLAIADVIHAYARCVRRDEPDRVAELFTADGSFETRDGHPDSTEYSVRFKLHGPLQIAEHLGAGRGKAHPVPLIHNLMVEVDGSTATANCVMEAQIYGTAHRIMGEYIDHFACIDGRWRFTSRVFTIYSGASAV